MRGPVAQGSDVTIAERIEREAAERWPRAGGRAGGWRRGAGRVRLPLALLGEFARGEAGHRPILVAGKSGRTSYHAKSYCANLFGSSAHALDAERTGGERAAELGGRRGAIEPARILGRAEQHDLAIMIGGDVGAGRAGEHRPGFGDGAVLERHAAAPEPRDAEPIEPPHREAPLGLGFLPLPRAGGDRGVGAER